MKIDFQMDYDRGNYIKQPVSIRFELKLLFSTSKQVVIFDIGACEGEESVKYSFLYPDANIYTFEPLPANIELIKGNFKKYGVSNASIHEVAVSSKDSFNHFYVSSGKPENIPDSDWEFGNKSSSLLEPSKYLMDNSFLTFKETIEVETITLKSFCKKHQINAIDFIHMDVQGAELMVLEGTDDLISAVKAIWLEVSTIDFYHNQPLVQDIKKFLNKNGFILLKNELHGEQGDQLYISKLHFSMLKVSFIKILMWAKFVVTRLTSILKLIL
jgi:FkbM family methyltransferase